MNNLIKELEEKAHDMRKKIITSCYYAGSGHPGSSLSTCEILSVLYHHVLNIDPKNPSDPDRDRFVLSKGHAAPALYSVLAQKGYFDEEELLTLRKTSSRLQGHPVMNKLPGIEITSGSLGMGISFGVGTILAARLQNKNYRTYVLTGDGELDEGQNWEGMLAAVKFKVDKMTVIVDYNKLQLDGRSDDILPIGNLGDKFRAFDFNVIQCDGHDILALIEAIEQAKQYKDNPSVIIADTIKGKGVSFMENRVEWHGKTINDEDFERAMAELNGGLN
ncbi:MAG: transketolase [Chlorobi bacterium]|nr:transketolase [Chlorobiota bacterium]